MKIEAGAMCKSDFESSSHDFEIVTNLDLFTSFHFYGVESLELIIMLNLLAFCLKKNNFIVSRDC